MTPSCFGAAKHRLETTSHPVVCAHESSVRSDPGSGKSRFLDALLGRAGRPAPGRGPAHVDARSNGHQEQEREHDLRELDNARTCRRRVLRRRAVQALPRASQQHVRRHRAASIALVWSAGHPTTLRGVRCGSQVVIGYHAGHFTHARRDGGSSPAVRCAVST